MAKLPEYVKNNVILDDYALEDGIRCLSCESGVCIACGYCSMICPVKAIRMEVIQDELGRTIVDKFEINVSACIFCGLCEQVCPTKVIEMENTYEFALYNNVDVVRMDEYFEYDEKKSFDQKLIINKG